MYDEFPEEDHPLNARPYPRKKRNRKPKVKPVSPTVDAKKPEPEEPESGEGELLAGSECEEVPEEMVPQNGDGGSHGPEEPGGDGGDDGDEDPGEEPDPEDKGPEEPEERMEGRESERRAKGEFIKGFKIQFQAGGSYAQQFPSFNSGEAVPRLMWVREIGKFVMFEGQGAEVRPVVVGVEAITRILCAKGMSKAIKYELMHQQSQVDYHLAAVQEVAWVDSMKIIGGYGPGVHLIDGRRVLIPEGPKIPKLREVPLGTGWWTARLEEMCPLHYKFLLSAHGDDVRQFSVFLHWLGGSYQVLYRSVWEMALDQERDFQPAQVAILCGGAGNGKTQLMEQVVMVFGGRSANPIQFLQGTLPWNDDLVGSEGWTSDDDALSTGKKERRTLSMGIKYCVGVVKVRVSKRQTTATMVKMFRRGIFCLNDDAESLEGMPLLNGAFADKIHVFQIRKAWLPPLDEGEDKKGHWARVLAQFEAEREAFQWYLKNRVGCGGGVVEEVPLPEEFVDESGRFPTKAFRTHAYDHIIEQEEPEDGLLEKIDATVFDRAICESPWVKYTTSELMDSVKRLAKANADKEISEIDVSIYKDVAWVGRLLGRLHQSKPDRVVRLKLLDGRHRYVISKPGVNVRSAYPNPEQFQDAPE